MCVNMLSFTEFSFCLQPYIINRTQAAVSHSHWTPLGMLMTYSKAQLNLLTSHNKHNATQFHCRYEAVFTVDTVLVQKHNNWLNYGINWTRQPDVTSQQRTIIDRFVVRILTAISRNSVWQTDRHCTSFVLPGSVCQASDVAFQSNKVTDIIKHIEECIRSIFYNKIVSVLRSLVWIIFSNASDLPHSRKTYKRAKTD
jgi:hypothetical protein